MSLIQEIENAKKDIFTDGYPMSIGELMSLYKEKEIDIHPEFQRIFRWTPLQKSKFIESIILGIPIPSIFISQRPDGVWDVVDGQQRLSTIFEFAGILRDENGELLPSSTLVKTNYLPSLDGVKWGSEEEPDGSFTNALKLSFRREKIDIKIVKKESDGNIKYDLFQRLNTLGSKLSDQEVRNCLLIMINKDFYLWIKELSNYPAFTITTSLSERLIKEQYQMELVLRFFLLKDHLVSIRNYADLNEFITEKMIEFADNYNPIVDRQIFEKTFDLLNFVFESDAFKRYNNVKARFEGAFLISAFEAIGVGLGKNITAWDGSERNGELKTEIEGRVLQVWSNPDIRENSGAGINAMRRAPVIIPIGEGIFSHED